VSSREVGLALEEKDAERIVVFEGVHLVERSTHFRRSEVARVDDHAEHARLRLPPRDREGVGTDGDPRVVCRDLHEIVEIVDGRNR